MEQRIINLINFCQGIYRNENGKALYHEYLTDIQSVTPQDVIFIENEQLKMGLSPKEMLTFVGKLMNVFNKPLSAYEWKKPIEGTFLYDMMTENEALINQLEAFKTVVKLGKIQENLRQVLEFLIGIQGYYVHFLKLENILFPTMEKKMERFNGLKIMWSLHDEVRKRLSLLMRLLDGEQVDEQLDEKQINIEIGQLYFDLYGLVQKQKLILFPSATELLDEKELQEMHQQSFEYGFAFIEKPILKEIYQTTELHRYDELGKLLTMDTGHLDLEQLSLIFNALPLDLTLVDEYDKVTFFTTPKDRIFPRSVAVIGRDVRNCHPPESVHIVEAILVSFKNGEKNEASFWFQMKGLYIYIQYIALRNAEGKYRGTLEISQEIGKLRALEGQRRLLEW